MPDATGNLPTAGRAQERSEALLDRIYRHQRHIYDPTRKFYLLGRDRLISGLAVSPGESVLEIGCGTGRNLIVAARRYRQAKFFGVDLSAAMLKTASSSIAKSGLAGRISLAQADAGTFDADKLFGSPCFDHVFFSYSLSMIPNWRNAIDRGWASVAPGGSLHIVDFGQCENLPGSFRTLLFAWLAQFHVVPRARLHGMLSAVALHSEAGFAFETLYGGYAWYGVLARRSTQSGETIGETKTKARAALAARTSSGAGGGIPPPV